MRVPIGFLVNTVLQAGGISAGILAVLAGQRSSGTVGKNALVGGAVAAIGASEMLKLVRLEKAQQRASLRSESHTKAFNVLLRELRSVNAYPSSVSEQLTLLSQGLDRIEKRGRTPSALLNDSTAVVPTVTPDLSAREFLLDENRRPFDYLELPASGRRIELETSEVRKMRLEFWVGSDGGVKDSRAALVFFKGYDRKGSEVAFPFTESFSAKYGYFAYLAVNGAETLNAVDIVIPANVSRITAGIVAWNQSPSVKNLVGIECSAKQPTKDRKLQDIKVACVLDEFSFNSFKYDCNLVPVEPENWRAVFRESDPDVFLCESAWVGADAARRPWRGKVYGSENFDYENRSALFDILAYCNDLGIPTVFWNKEDPSHFDDKVHNFVDTALRFDHIFSTDSASVERYKKEFGHASAHLLPFAVQPRLFNPVERGVRSEEVVFAGGWYSNHRQRCSDMVAIFDAVLSAGIDLKIYDRFYHFTDDDTHIFPERYQKYIVPPVAGDEMADVYKEAKWSITINTETKSETMFARRIFELAACNTLVISNYSRGVDKCFGDGVVFTGQLANDMKLTNELWASRARTANLERVLSQHTYQHRLRKIFDIAGVGYAPEDHNLEIVTIVDSWDQANRSFKRMVSYDDEFVSRMRILVRAHTHRTEFGMILRDFNRDGVTVHEIENANLDSDTEAFVLLVPFAQLEKQEQMQLVNERLSLHTKYSDLPIMIAGRGDGVIREEYSSFTDPVLLREKELSLLLRRISCGQSFPVLSVSRGD